MISGDELRHMTMELPRVEEQQTWGHPTSRVDDKIVVGLSDDETTARIKTSQDEQQDLIAADPHTFSVAAYVGQHGWTEALLAVVDRDQLRELVAGTWRRTAPHPSNSSTDPVRLRIVTLNVQTDEGDPRRLGLINRELRALQPDLLALQGVLRTDQLGDLLDQTELHGTHAIPEATSIRT